MHEDLVENAKKAISEIFSDTSVSPATTRESLEELQSEIETYLDALDADNYTDNEE